MYHFVEEYGSRLVMFQMIRKMESDIENTGKKQWIDFRCKYYQEYLKLIVKWKYIC